MTRKSRPLHLFRRLLATVALGCIPAASLAQPGHTSSATVAVDDVALYDQHVKTLANPFFEGRAPGTHGNLLAADYIETYFKKYGLEPAFAGEDGAPSYRQSFNFGETTTLKSEFARYTLLGTDGSELVSQTLSSGDDYVVTDYSGSGVATGSLAFAGYAIESGPDGYASFAEGTDFTGRVVIVLRFEPLNDKGGSRFTNGHGWSPSAAIDAKLKAVAARGAAGIIMVSPPEADDPRARQLAPINSMSAVGGALEIPVFMMPFEAADAMVVAAGGSLDSLRAEADAKGVIAEFPNLRVLLTAEIENTPIVTANVGGIIRGRGALADEYVVIGAHYDHVGYGEFGSRGGAAARGVIHPGADDNASGTSGVLLLAKRLSETYAAEASGPDARSILLLTFTAEESGLNGSQYYVRNMIAPKEKHFAMLNMDMIGRLRDDKLQIEGVGTAEGMEEFIKPRTDATGMDLAFIPGGMGPSDHASFTRAGIPVLAFFTGYHDEYHTPADVAALINDEGAVRVIDLVQGIAHDLAVRSEALAFVRPERSGVASGSAGPTRLRVRFGIMPGDYSGSVKGVLVGDVSDGTAAAEAGLKAGDLIVSWNGKPLDGVESWMPLLADAKPGDEVEVTYMRDGKELKGKGVLRAAGGGG